LGFAAMGDFAPDVDEAIVRRTGAANFHSRNE